MNVLKVHDQEIDFGELPESVELVALVYSVAGAQQDPIIVQVKNRNALVPDILEEIKRRGHFVASWKPIQTTALVGNIPLDALGGTKSQMVADIHAASEFLQTLAKRCAQLTSRMDDDPSDSYVILLWVLSQSLRESLKDVVQAVAGLVETGTAGKEKTNGKR